MPELPNHCEDIGGDRALGAAWEVRFCTLAADQGQLFTPHQHGRDKMAAAHYRVNGTKHRVTLPDVTIWSGAGEHHEIKHKKATDTGHYGLECYRFDSLLEFARRIDGLVYYTIHDHSRLGKHSQLNELRDWRTCEINRLLGATVYDPRVRKLSCGSWVNGVATPDVPQWFWPTDLFTPLGSLWGLRLAESDHDADFWDSKDDCLSAVRERKANGGPGWEPK